MLLHHLSRHYLAQKVVNTPTQTPNLNSPTVQFAAARCAGSFCARWRTGFLVSVRRFRVLGPYEQLDYTQSLESSIRFRDTYVIQNPVARRRLLLNSDVEQLVAAKLLWAAEDGSPIAPSDSDGAAEMAAIARRRWNSYERRNKNVPDTIENRITDLMRGLGEHCETGGWRMVGGLESNYRWLAEQVAPILAGNI